MAKSYGRLYLAREILRLWPDVDSVDKLLPLLDEVYRARWYPHYQDMMDTLSQQMPVATEFVMPSVFARDEIKKLSILELNDRERRSKK